MSFQAVVDAINLFADCGVVDAVLSPGSRNAPLTLALARNPKISCKTITDERSAAYIGLGQSLVTDQPTILTCTSGSAAFNYGPAISEAYNNEVPLLILTADRPPEWIDQKEGQSIYQKNLYGKHVKKCFQAPVSLKSTAAKKRLFTMAKTAYELANTAPKGPVHINWPFREPFYPKADKSYTPTTFEWDESPQVGIRSVISPDMIATFNKSTRILMVVGQQQTNMVMAKNLEFVTDLNILVLGDCVANLHECESLIDKHDLFLQGGKQQDDLRPELLITIGLSVLSKKLKQFLRSNKPEQHWHIHDGYAPDTYRALTHHVPCHPLMFLRELQAKAIESKPSIYFQHWQKANHKANRFLQAQLDGPGNHELKAVASILHKLPSSTDLHLANSMSVRYVNYLGLEAGNDTKVYCNRGVSGIDGTNSTAVGTHLSSNRQTLIITGDLAFFYDNNAFWHNYDLSGLKVVVLNNQGGAIFGAIKGPSGHPELNEYFETRQTRQVSTIAANLGLTYFEASAKEGLSCLSEFLATPEAAVLEVHSDQVENRDELQAFMSAIAQFSS